jgi:hypothetical protein
MLVVFVLQFSQYQIILNQLLRNLVDLDVIVLIVQQHVNHIQADWLINDQDRIHIHSKLIMLLLILKSKNKK